MKRPVAWSSLLLLVLSVGLASAVGYDRSIPVEELRERAQLTPAFSAFGARRMTDPAASTTTPNNNNNGNRGGNYERGNRFVNDPCLDPAPGEAFPANFARTVQSNTEIAALNRVQHASGNENDDDIDDDSDANNGEYHSNWSGKLLVAAYNDSYGQYDNRQGVSGFSYSTNGGRQWIDAGGLPPLVPSGAPLGTPGSDSYYGDPSLVVHHRTQKFYYSSLYQNPAGGYSVSVNRGEFRVAPQQVPVESYANTRRANRPELHGIPDPPAFIRKRIIWDPPVEAVLPGLGADEILNTDDDDTFDKPWLYVNQETGVLYLTYTRFGVNGSTPIEVVRSFDGGQTWSPPSVILPDVTDTLNQGPRVIVTPTGRVVVSWIAQTYEITPVFREIENRVEVAFSDNCQTPAPCTFSPPIVVDIVSPQGAPLGYNRFESTVSNLPFITVDKGRDDGVITKQEARRPGFGNIYITYFDGKTSLPQEVPPDCYSPQDPCNPYVRQADILLTRSVTNGTTWGPPVKVNDDPGDTSHVFPSVQVNKHGDVFVTWIDRRVDRPRNLLNDTFGDISKNGGVTFRNDGRISSVSTDWISREDRMPDYGDYNSSEVLRFSDFMSIWSDGRFPQPQPITSQEPPFERPEDDSATPDTLTGIMRRNGSIKP